METGATRVPQTVDALLDRMESTFSGTGVLVIDGPVGALDLPDDVLAVGLAGPDNIAVTNQVQRMDGLGHRLTEEFEINCVFSSRSGGTDMQARRNRCLWAIQQVDAALKADRGLGDVVDLAGLGGAMQWAQEQHPDGATCEVMFAVVGRALL